jgi:hypothetical protein
MHVNLPMTDLDILELVLPDTMALPEASPSLTAGQAAVATATSNIHHHSSPPSRIPGMLVATLNLLWTEDRTQQTRMGLLRMFTLGPTCPQCLGDTPRRKPTLPLVACHHPLPTLLSQSMLRFLRLSNPTRPQPHHLIIQGRSHPCTPPKASAEHPLQGNQINNLPQDSLDKLSSSPRPPTLALQSPHRVLLPPPPLLPSVVVTGMTTDTEVQTATHANLGGRGNA